MKTGCDMFELVKTRPSISEAVSEDRIKWQPENISNISYFLSFLSRTMYSLKVASFSLLKVNPHTIKIELTGGIINMQIPCTSLYHVFLQMLGEFEERENFFLMKRR